MICWSIEARKIPKNSGSRLIEASLVHGFTSEPEKEKYNYTLDIKLLIIFPQDYIQNVWEKVGKTPPFEIVTEGPHILVEIAGNLL